MLALVIWPRRARSRRHDRTDRCLPPTVVQRRRSWRPALGAPRHVLDTTFSGVGLTMAAWFFALSLLPSLLPRAALVQGIVSGVTVMVGYGIGAGTQALWRYLGIPGVPGRARRVLVAIFVGLGLWAAVFTGWRLVGWQNEIRTLYGMEPASPTVWPVILGLTALLAVLILVVARGAAPALPHGLPVARASAAPPRRGRRRLGRAPGGHLVAAHRRPRQRLLRRRQQHLRAARHAHRRGHEPAPGAAALGQPAVAVELGAARAAGPLLRRWRPVGGRARRGERRRAPRSRSASTPDCAPPTRCRAAANLVLAELKRTGAFDRKVLVVATTTGTGFLDQNGTDPLEFLWNGDTAIAGVQYSYLPSWISLLADQDAVRRDVTRRLRHGAPVLVDAARVEPPQALPLRALARLARGREHPQLRQRHQRADRRRAHVRTAVRQRDARPAHRGTPARQPGIPPRLRAGPHGPLHRRAGRAGARGPGLGTDPPRLPAARQ